jgi:hypothetical protein
MQLCIMTQIMDESNRNPHVKIHDIGEYKRKWRFTYLYNHQSDRLYFWKLSKCEYNQQWTGYCRFKKHTYIFFSLNYTVYILTKHLGVHFRTRRRDSAVGEVIRSRDLQQRTRDPCSGKSSECFSFSICSDGSTARPAFTPWVLWALSLAVKRPGVWTVHSSLASVEVRNDWNSSFTSPYVFMV